MKIFSPLLATADGIPVEMVHLGEDSKAGRSHQKTAEVVSGDLRKWGSFEESVGRWGLRVWKESLSCFQGNFKEPGAGFLLIAAFARQTITLPRYLSDLIPYEKPTIPFFSICCPGSEVGKEPRLQWGQGVPRGPDTLSGEEQPVGRFLQTSSPSWPCQPAACPGATQCFLLELPQWPASSWLRLCWIFTFFSP